LQDPVGVAVGEVDVSDSLVLEELVDVRLSVEVELDSLELDILELDELELDGLEVEELEIDEVELVGLVVGYPVLELLWLDEVDVVELWLVVVED